MTVARCCGNCDHCRRAVADPRVLLCKHPHRGNIPGCRWNTKIAADSGRRCPLWRQPTERKTA